MAKTTNKKVPRVDLGVLISMMHQFQANGVKYGLGAKAEGGRNPNTGQIYNPASNRTLSTPLGTIHNIDCSGAVRYGIYHATGKSLVIPDGSQNQRVWAEENLRQVASHADYGKVQEYLGENRLFLCFIRPGSHGCGPVGHVWFVLNSDADPLAETWESHGGQGPNSRPWNTMVLKSQVYSVFEFPAKP